MKDDLHQGLNPDQLHVKHLELSLESGHNLPILLVHVDKERLEAVVNGLGKEPKVEFEQGIKEE